MKRLLAFVRGVALAIPLLLTQGCTKTPSEPAGPEPQGRTSSCPEVLVADTGPELFSLDVRSDGMLFAAEVDDSTWYSGVRYFALPEANLESLEYAGSRVSGGALFAGPTRERPLFNAFCTNDGAIVWSYVDSLSATGYTDIGVWQDPVTKKWAYQWLPPEEPKVGPFDGCDILPNTAERDPDSGEWWATSPTEGQILRVSEDGLWIPTGTPWTKVRFFGERGELPGVIETAIGPDGFVPRPPDRRYHDLNPGFDCTDTSFVWSLIVDLTMVPEGVIVARHSNGKACFRVTAWMEDEPEPGECKEDPPGSGTGPRVEGHEKLRGSVKMTGDCYEFALFFGPPGTLEQAKTVEREPDGAGGWVFPYAHLPKALSRFNYYHGAQEFWALVDSTSAVQGIDVVEQEPGAWCYEVLRND